MPVVQEYFTYVQQVKAFQKFSWNKCTVLWKKESKQENLMILEDDLKKMLNLKGSITLKMASQGEFYSVGVLMVSLKKKFDAHRSLCNYRALK